MYFLGIVTDANMLEGIITPGYVLCKANGKSENRSGWRVINLTLGPSKMMLPKLLVNSPTGHDEMIDFLSHFRTREHMHGDNNYTHEATKKYYPHGALFWFECNKYGDQTGHALFVKRVPEKRKHQNVDNGFRDLKLAMAHTPGWYELLTKDHEAVLFEGTDQKAVLPQKSTRNYVYQYTYSKWRRYKKQLKERKEKEDGQY